METIETNEPKSRVHKTVYHRFCTECGDHMVEVRAIMENRLTLVKFEFNNKNCDEQ